MLDVSYSAAAIAGLLSFLSPCILPIVPFYLSYMAGVSINQVAADGTLTAGVRMRAVAGATFFAAGVLTIFMGLGATSSLLGQAVRDWFDVLRYAAAALILAMGLHFLGVVRIGILYRQLRADTGTATSVGLLGASVIGLAFAFGWTPCVGPVLAMILMTAAAEESASAGAALLFVYGAAMTFPFILAALFIGPFLGFMRRARPWMGTIEKAMGAMLILFAVLIATDTINVIADFMLTWRPDIGVLR